MYLCTNSYVGGLPLENVSGLRFGLYENVVHGNIVKELYDWVEERRCLYCTLYASVLYHGTEV